MTSSSSRSASTRTALLVAAREVFAAAGFADTAVADIVDRANASVGSLYHHFGGKAELYLALFVEFQERQEARAAAAVRSAREEGETDVFGLFLVGSRAFLEGCWTERDLARIFLAGGGPPGFDLVARRRYREWTRRNAILLSSSSDEPWGDALILILTTVVNTAGHEVAVCEDEVAAQALSEDILVLIQKMGR